MELLLDSIVPDPDQPRTHFDEAALQELADSIALHGVLQPIAVRPHGDKWMIIAGERRWRAAQLAGLLVIPAVSLALGETAVREAALIENIQRQDLNPIEEALAYQHLVGLHGSAAAVAKRVGKSRSVVSNAIRLLQLPPEVLHALATGTLSPGHGILLLQVKDPVLQQQLFHHAVLMQITVRDLQVLIDADHAVSSRAPRQVRVCPACKHEF